MKRVVIIVLLFLVCFLGTLVLKDSELFGGKKDVGSYGNYKPEVYELQENSVVDLDKISVLQRLDAERTHMINNVIPSVVCISSEGLQRQIIDRTGRTELTAVRDIGSGVVVSHQGHIVTNNHVVAGKERFTVSTYNGVELEAKLIGADPTLDIAVLKVELEGGEIKPLQFGDSDDVRVGQMVFAVGNPFGLGETVTQGIISAKERSFSDEQRDLFQTDAAINPGNSGGPLVNTKGEVIGINVSIYSAEEGKPNSQGVGFSLPANEVLRSFQQIAEKGRPVRAYLGVKLRNLTPEGKTFLGYKGSGVAVAEVTKGSPAEKAGLLPTDVILSYSGKEIQGTRQLINSILRSEVDQEVALQVLRNGEKIELTAMVIDLMNSNGSQETIKDETYNQMMQRVAYIGLRVRDLEWIEKRRGATVGVVVSQIASSSLAARLKLMKGDLVIRINDQTLKNPEQFYKALINAKEGEDMTMVVQRGNRQAPIRFTLN